MFDKSDKTNEGWFVLQVIEQDRHLLRRKLVCSQTEYDARMLELQTDVQELQKALDKTEHNFKATEKEKALFIAELRDQNQRLTTQIKEVCKQYQWNILHIM